MSEGVAGIELSPGSGGVDVRARSGSDNVTGGRGHRTPIATAEGRP